MEHWVQFCSPQNISVVIIYTLFKAKILNSQRGPHFSNHSDLDKAAQAVWSHFMLPPGVFFFSF